MLGGGGGRACVKQTLTDSPPEQNRENKKAGGGEVGRGEVGGGGGSPYIMPSAKATPVHGDKSLSTNRHVQDKPSPKVFTNHSSSAQCLRHLS